MTNHEYAFEPEVRLSDVGGLRSVSWEAVDAAARRALGQEGLVVPSVRIALVWALDYLGYRRHTDHVVVPRFLGRCILNSLNRQALPVEAPTAQTRAVLHVDQWGLRARPRGEERELVRIEDSPCGFGADLTPEAGSLVRVIGLAKALPIAHGAFLVTPDAGLRAFVERRRHETSRWALPVWWAVYRERRQWMPARYSARLNAAYEMYPDIGGGAGVLRSNIATVLSRIDAFAEESLRRLALCQSLDPARALRPDADRVAYVVPYLTRGDDAWLCDCFRRLGFHGGTYHVDTARDLWAPTLERAVLLPLHARVPFEDLQRLVEAIGAREGCVTV